MSQTGVLPFVRGIDFDKYSFDEDVKQPKLLSDLQRLRWIRMCHTGMTKLPDELATLKKLEQLHATHNNVEAINKDIVKLSCLRVLNLRYNKIRNENVPTNLNELEDLAVFDLSYNDLKEVPTNLEEAKSILVLNLGHNHIHVIPNYVFINLTDLVHLDLSSNKLEMLPPQLRRLVHLKTLILNDNPLLHAQLRQLPALVSLESLHLANTQRTLTNIPQGIENLRNLKDLDVSRNNLAFIPEHIYRIKSLRRLNISQNSLTELSHDIGELDELVTLNVSRNKLVSLPNSLCRLARLRKLFVNSNELGFIGVPAGIGKLGELEIFSASDNRLETLPEGLCRCGKLRKLLLNKNRLYTLPEAIHFLQLQELDVSDNPDFTMPPKPVELQKAVGAGVMFYNIDFSLQHQLMLAGATPQQISASTNGNSQSPQQAAVKDPIARKKRLKLLKQNVDESSKVLKGMRDAAKQTTKKDSGHSGSRHLEEALIKGKRWDEQLEKPKLDYSEFFDDDVGQIPGIVCYEIEKFLPSPVDPALNGKFYEGDCYIVLKTFLDEQGGLNWQIYFWIGSQASLDKQACAAMHAVNLRNLLGATCRTIREEQNDESDEFLDLFGTSLCYVEGAHTTSGFYTVEDIEYLTRMYKISGTHRLVLDPVPLTSEALDPRFVYLLDDGMTIYLWNGLKSNPITRSKARLFAEKINKYERKFQAELIQQKQFEEVEQFWELLGGPPASRLKTNILATILSDQKPDESTTSAKLENERIENEISANAASQALSDIVLNDPTVYFRPKLYKVGIGMGYLELPQVKSNSGKLVLTRKLLDTRGVYILDCFTDIFVWIGLKSTRLVRTAALKLSTSLEAMINRPNYTLVTSTLEGTESQIFKSKFEGWDDLIAVDYTRTAQMVSKKLSSLKRNDQNQNQNQLTHAGREGSVDTAQSNHLHGSNRSVRAQSVTPNPTQQSALPPVLQNPSEPLKTDLVALFVDRYEPAPDEEALAMMEEINDFLESMECFVFENKRFVRLPEKEFGQFYSEDSYLFVCKYWKIEESTNEPPKEGAENGNDENGNDEEEQSEGTIECKLYFWQGRDANQSGWLTFTFSLKKKFKDIEIIKLNQQQESPQFLAHFKRKFIIHKGKRKPHNQPAKITNTEGTASANNNKSLATKMYHLRKNPYSAICTRCIQLQTARANYLNSEFCYIVCVPFEDSDSSTKGIVYVWIGSKANPDEANLAEEIAQYMYEDSYSIQVLNEGEEPETFFWHSLDGKKPYDQSAEYMKYMRLFRCSNDRGYFAVTEKCIDFCQDDLSDDDIMILDNGEFIYLWIGPTSTEIEVKLAFKSAQVYIQHLKNKQPNKPRKLLLTTKGKEAPGFTKCFHGWTKHKIVPTNLEKKIILKPKEANN